MREEADYHLEYVDENDIFNNFKYSVALANLGRVEEAYDHFDYMGDKISSDKFNKVIEPYLKKLEKKPDDILLLNYAAFAASINNQYQESVKYFNEILSIKPENIWIMNYKALALLELKEYDRAEKLCNKTIKIKDNQFSHLILGMVYYKRGETLKALIQLGKSGDLAKRVIW
ncbi:MAG: tetratricopeptide repeat protein [bacterium]